MSEAFLDRKPTALPVGQNLLLRASAGTGKTYQLVERYAEMVLEGGLSPAEVVVITFTRKAAAELRQRIERRLRAGGADGATLAALAQAPIDNFHGLCLRLLDGGFASLPVGPAPPDVLGEAGEDAELFVAATQAAWLSTPALAADVAAVAAHMPVDEATLEHLWAALARAREDGREVSGELWGEAYDAAAAQASAHATLAAHRAQVSAGSDACTTPTARAALAAFLAAPAPAPTAPLAAWAEGWRAVWAKFSRRGQLGKLLDDACLRAARTLPDACVAEAGCEALQPALRRLLDAAWQAYVAAKARQHSRDFADIVAEVVRRLASEPEMHRAVRRTVRAVLVDEAQDTNREQRRLVHLLVGLAGPAASAHPPARLLVVGDWKQCIYTFRGADPENFARFADDVARTGGRDETLERSYRSCPAVVTGINALGRHLFAGAYEPLVAAEEATSVAAAPTLMATPTPTPTSPPISPRSPALAEGVHWLPVLGADGASPNLAELAARTADVVAQTLADGVAPHDVAVLLAGLRNQAPAYVDALAARGIDAVTSGGGALYAREEVRHLLALLAWLADEARTLQAAIALRSPAFALPDAALWALFGEKGRAAGALAALRRGDAGPARAALDAATAEEVADALAYAADCLPALVRAVASLPAAAACHAVVDGLDLRALMLAGDQAPQRLANLARVFALAERAERQQVPTAAFALQQLARLQAGAAEAEGSVSGSVHGAVTLSTVHKSKGLQWRVVVLAGLNRGQSARGPTVAYHRRHGLVFAPQGPRGTQRTQRYAEAHAAAERDDAEQLQRLAYVAVTRAQARVVCVAPEVTRGATRGLYRLLAPWRALDPPELGLLRSEDVPVAAPAPAKALSSDALVRENDALRDAHAAVHAARALPSGTRLHLSVTELAREGLDAGAAGPVNGVAENATVQPCTANLAALGVSAARVAASAGPARPKPRGPPLATLVAQAVAGESLVAHDPRALGTLVHELLAHGAVPDGADSEAGREKAAAGEGASVEAWLRHRGLAPDSPSFVQVRAAVSAFLRSPLGVELRALPPEARRHELPFVLTRTVAGVTAELRGQVDLLAWRNGAPWVVDFKYALPTPNEVAYVRQLEAYAWAASELCGYRGPVPCDLVYLRQAGAVSRHVVTQSQQNAVAARLEAWLAGRRVQARGDGGAYFEQ